jgi:mannose/cellobiose epimerase-like protein (N-acyl-D-glucosamine 2-epimerase family)
MTQQNDSPLAHGQRDQKRLLQWFLEQACPLWSTHGADRVRGGFHERLNGTQGLHEPRRARVQPRQVSSFAQAALLGWKGDAAELATHGLRYFRQYFRRTDGLFRTLIGPDGESLDERALLYDQAFALLGLAEAQHVLPSASLPDEARQLRATVSRLLRRSAGPGFETGLPLGQPLCANPHMHLFEAALAWIERSDDAEWRALADEIGSLALSRFIDPSTGVLREHFDAGWTPLPGTQGRLLEPGHHFEWAWLLLRWSGASRPEVRRAAFRLIDIAEQHGVRNGVAVNALLDDLSVHDASARLWPQTERLKASALAARMTGETRYWVMAHAAATGLFRYLETKVPGSWYDKLTPDGKFLDEPAPASTFYHLAAAAAQLTASVKAAAGNTAPGSP